MDRFMAPCAFMTGERANDERGSVSCSRPVSKEENMRQCMAGIITAITCSGTAAECRKLGIVWSSNTSGNCDWFAVLPLPKDASPQVRKGQCAD